MRKLSRIFAPALCAAIALGATAPAQAAPAPTAHTQPAPYQPGFHQYGPTQASHAYPASSQSRSAAINHRINELERAVNRNDGRNRISEREAASLRREVRELSQQFHRYDRNGLSKSEYRTLERRIERIRARLHVERHDRDRHPG